MIGVNSIVTKVILVYSVAVDIPAKAINKMYDFAKEERVKVK